MTSGQGRVTLLLAIERVLDEKITFLMRDLLQEVMRSGTAGGVWSLGFRGVAAGKTGTSRDGWFVGYTSKLLCAVWVGFDDNKDIGLEGGKIALPIWTEFMKRAHAHRQYRSVTDFAAPDGVVTVEIDPATGLLATASCPNPKNEVFIAGTQPVDVCKLHGGGAASQVATWDPAPAPTVRRPSASPARPMPARCAWPPRSARGPAR